MTATESMPLLQRMDAEQQIRVIAALAIILAAGGFLILFIRASGRVARWYVNRPHRITRLMGDPLRGRDETIHKSNNPVPQDPTPQD